MSGKLGHTQKDLFIPSLSQLVIFTVWSFHSRPGRSIFREMLRGVAKPAMSDSRLCSRNERGPSVGRGENKPGGRRWRRDVCAAPARAVTPVVARAGECLVHHQPPQSCHNRGGGNMWDTVTWDTNMWTSGNMWDNSSDEYWTDYWELAELRVSINSDTLMWWLVSLTAIRQLRAR